MRAFLPRAPRFAFAVKRYYYGDMMSADVTHIEYGEREITRASRAMMRRCLLRHYIVDIMLLHARYAHGDECYGGCRRRLPIRSMLLFCYTMARGGCCRCLRRRRDAREIYFVCCRDGASFSARRCERVAERI